MISFEDFKEKALATAGKVADKSVSLARTAGEKAKILGKITKLKTEIAVEKDTMRKTYIELGKLHYEKHKHNPDPDVAQAMADISLSHETVAAKQAQVEALKKELADDFGETVEEIKDEVKEKVEDAE